MLRLILGLALVAALGFLRLYDPIGGDQALFLVAARELAHGAVLYRDFWDLKQPGIFAFYSVAGSLGGWSFETLHAFELVWNLALATTAWLLVRGRLARPSFALAAPLFVVGGTYAVADGSMLTQVELVVSLPLMLCTWATLEAFAATSMRRAIVLAAAAGLAAGVAILFKLLFVAIVFVIVAIAYARRMRTAIGGPTVLLTWLAASAVPPLVFAATVWRDGTLAEVVTTFFVLPSRIVESVGHAPPQRLIDSATWFVVSFGYLLPLAAVGAWRANASERRSIARADLRAIAIGYLAAALVVIVVQVQSWWTYHFVLLVPPLGILATLGVERIVTSLRSVPNRRMATVALIAAAIGFLPCASTSVRSVARIARDRPFASAAAAQRYRLRISGEYARAADIATYLDGPAFRGGGVYVAGDPLIYTIAHRDQGVAINGWALELYPPERWRALESQFVASAPRFVFISSEYDGILRTHSSAISTRLATAYAVGRRTADGTWYRARN